MKKEAEALNFPTSDKSTLNRILTYQQVNKRKLTCSNCSESSSTPCSRPQAMQATPENIWQNVRIGLLPQQSITRIQKIQPGISMNTLTTTMIKKNINTILRPQ